MDGRMRCREGLRSGYALELQAPYAPQRLEFPLSVSGWYLALDVLCVLFGFEGEIEV